MKICLAFTIFKVNFDFDLLVEKLYNWESVLCCVLNKVHMDYIHININVVVVCKVMSSISWVFDSYFILL